MKYVILSHVGVKSLIEQFRGMLIHDSPAQAITLKLILFTFKCIKAILCTSPNMLSYLKNGFPEKKQTTIMLLGACFSPRWSVCSECGSATSVFGTLIMMSLRKVDDRTLTQNPGEKKNNKLDSLELFIFEISLWSTCHAFVSNV